MRGCIEHMPMVWWRMILATMFTLSSKDALPNCLNTSSNAFLTLPCIFDTLYLCCAATTGWEIFCWCKKKECNDIRIISLKLCEINNINWLFKTYQYQLERSLSMWKKLSLFIIRFKHIIRYQQAYQSMWF